MIIGPNVAQERSTTHELSRPNRHAQLELDIAMLRTLMSTGLSPRESLAVFRRELSATQPNSQVGSIGGARAVAARSPI